MAAPDECERLRLAERTERKAPRDEPKKPSIMAEWFRKHATRKDVEHEQLQDAFPPSTPGTERPLP